MTGLAIGLGVLGLAVLAGGVAIVWWVERKADQSYEPIEHGDE